MDCTRVQGESWKQTPQYLTWEHFFPLSFKLGHCAGSCAPRRAASDSSRHLQGSGTGVPSPLPTLLENNTCTPGHPTRTVAPSPLKAWPRRAEEKVSPFCLLPCWPCQSLPARHKINEESRRVPPLHGLGTEMVSWDADVEVASQSSKAGYSCPSSSYMDKQLHHQIMM